MGLVILSCGLGVVNSMIQGQIMKNIYIYYTIYVVNALITSFIILTLFFVSAGFANYFPILALIGCVVLFVLAAPITMYNFRAGLVVGSIGNILVLPYQFLFTKGIIDDHVWNWVILLGIVPLTLSFLAFYLLIRLRLNKVLLNNTSSNGFLRVFLTAIPILLFISYVYFFGNYWGYDDFNLK